MRRILFAVVFGLIACEATPKAEGSWLSFNEGLAQATKKGRPMMVDVYTDWCHWCKVLDKETFQDPKVKQTLESSFVSVKLNAESPTEKINYRGQTFSAMDFAANAGVEGYPCVLFFAKDGTMVFKVPGFVKPDEFQTILEYVQAEKYKAMKYEDFRKTRGKV